ncbi:MAG: DUF2157 domain-containing protein [Longimicrobiales bacterium]|nr:DUF2157 domain-containing protein [Longimicrobiales bacterium]
MNRKELGAFAAHYALSADAVEVALELVDARPPATDVRAFCARLLQLAGVLSLAAGVVFFVAANWALFGVFGRFALVEIVLLMAVALALWRPPPRLVGRYALLLAFIVTGALFALFGQTYQTGADVYELFLNWALLGLIFVVAAQWSVVWAAWVLVLNVALALYCAARPEGGLLWRLLAGWEMNLSHLLLIPLAVNTVLWGTSMAAEGTPRERLAPPWLGRFALTCAAAYGTWAALLVVVGSGREGVLGLLVPLLVFAGVAWHTLRRRRDVFPLAVIEAGLIVVSTAWIVDALDFDGTGILLVVAIWLVVSSTVSSYYLMRLVRAWEPLEEGVQPGAGEPAK